MTDNSKHIKKTISPALLVIDVQNYYLGMIPTREKDLATFFINLLIDLFRKHDFPVIRIYHFNKESGPDPATKEFEYPESIFIKPDDTQIIKSYSDSFNKTNLNDVLTGYGSNTLFLCGLSAVGCVLASKTGAQNHNYNAFIVKDAIMSHRSTAQHQRLDSNFFITPSGQFLPPGTSFLSRRSLFNRLPMIRL